MKKKLAIKGLRKYAITKVLLIMKLTTILILASIFHASAKVNGQTKLTLKLNQVEISQVLNNIENRLLKIICAVIRTRTPYIPGYRSVNPMLLQKVA